MPAPIKDYDALFAKRTMFNAATGCVEWIGALTSAGYGLLVKDRNRLTAHRFQYERSHGVRLRKDQHVCHKCDNPKCVNLAHLFIGSHAENMADKTAKGRQHRPISADYAGERNPMAKISDLYASDIRSRLKLGETQRSIATRYGIDQSTVSNINTGRRRSHATF